MSSEVKQTAGSDTEQESINGQLDTSMAADRSTAGDDDLAVQLSQLQDLVEEMKVGFSTAMQALSDIQYGDRCLQHRLEQNSVQYEQQISGVVDMVLTLKNEFGSVVGQLQIANESQRSLQQQVEYLQCERDVLIEELEKGGAISNVRSKCQSRLADAGSAQLNASLSAFLEKKHTNYSTHLTSDQDSGVTAGHQGELSSCEDVPPHHTFSPMVQPFIAALNDQNFMAQEEDYDSDSSITAAANKSLDLSRSLGDKCGDFTQSDSSDEEAASVSQHETPRGINLQDLQKSSMVEPPYETSSPKKQTVTSPRILSPRGISSAKKVAPHERGMKDTHRAKVAREILETERKYCSSLWTVIDTFAEQIKDSGYVSAKDYSIMFPMSLNRIYEHHCNLLHKLEQRMLHWQWQGLLGDIFARFTDTNNMDLLKLYQKYANEFPLVLNQIKRCCRQSNKFRKLLRKLQLQACEGLDLPSFMLTPIQRIPRYVLLLKQLLKHTEASHPDYYYIESSLEKLGHFLHQLNDSIEFSMQAVMAAPNSPKGVKRKLRQLSMRSNGSSSTTDPNQMSSATRDSGILSNGEEPAAHPPHRLDARLSLSQCRSHDRKLPYGDSLLYLQDAVCYSHASPANFNNTDKYEHLCHSLPYSNKSKRKVKVKRSHSSKLPPENIGPVKAPSYPANIPSIQMEGCALLDPVYMNDGVSTSVRQSKVRSLVDQTSGASLESQASSSSAYSSLPDHNSSCDSATVHSRSPSTISQQMSTRTDGCMDGLQLRGKQDDRYKLAQSMPRIPKHYGIFGDSEETAENSDYPSVMEGVRSTKLSSEQRSKSQGDILRQDSDSPTQQHINLSLVRSLTQDILSPPVHSRDTNTVTSSTPVCFTESADHTDCADASVLLNSTDVSTLKRKEMKKRKKDKQKKAGDLDESRYKKGAVVLRDSLKRIFGKRNNSNSGKVVEVGPVKAIGFASQSGDEQTSQSAAVSDKSQNLAAEAATVNPIHSTCTNQLDFTYEDEDGDPCSNV